MPRHTRKRRNRPPVPLDIDPFVPARGEGKALPDNNSCDSEGSEVPMHADHNEPHQPKVPDSPGDCHCEYHSCGEPSLLCEVAAPEPFPSPSDVQADSSGVPHPSYSWTPQERERNLLCPLSVKDVASSSMIDGLLPLHVAGSRPVGIFSLQSLCQIGFRWYSRASYIEPSQHHCKPFQMGVQA